MTATENAARDQRTCGKILSIFQTSESLVPHIDSISVVVENAEVVIEGELPSLRLIDELVPAIRQAGVLSRVQNRVRVA